MLWRISLETSQSITPNSTIEVEITNTDTEKEDAEIIMKVKEYSQESRKYETKQFFIKREEYNKICNNLLNIRPNDILSDNRLFIDGDSILLKFMSDNFQQIEYSLHGFNFDEKTTPSKELLFAVKSILKLANIEIYGINKFKESTKI